MYDEKTLGQGNSIWSQAFRDEMTSDFRELKYQNAL